MEANWSHLHFVSRDNDDKARHTVGLSLTSVVGVKVRSVKDRISTRVSSRMLGLFGPTGGQGDWVYVIIR